MVFNIDSQEKNLRIQIFWIQVQEFFEIMLDSREDQVKQERRGIRAKFQLRPYVPLLSTQHRFCTKGPEIGDKESWKIILFTRHPPAIQ